MATTYPPIYIGVNQRLRYRGANDAGVFLNSGTATWSLEDRSGAVLATGSLLYEATSDGNYSTVLSHSVTSGLIAGALYHVRVVFDQGGGAYHDTRRRTFLAQYRD